MSTEMSGLREMSVEAESAAKGTVVVSVELPVTPARAWEALTEPEVAAKWFGELTQGLRQGGASRLDFGDGDFFDIVDVKLAPPQLIQYGWRFLGVGPLDTVTWRVAPADGGGCRVTVTDSEPFRSAEAAAMLREGWLDFTSRLVGFLVTGRPTRYDWRRELDGIGEIPRAPSDARTLFEDAGAQSAWLPFGGAALAEGAEFAPPDGLPPRTFAVRNLKREGADSASFRVECDGWLAPTECELELRPHGEGALLSFSHTGWEAISRDPEEQLTQRRRFCELWVAALGRARQVLESGAAGGGAFRARDA
jgi:uncharacterized protein YndB with AHSA1/START domain